MHSTCPSLSLAFGSPFDRPLLSLSHIDNSRASSSFDSRWRWCSRNRLLRAGNAKKRHGTTDGGDSKRGGEVQVERMNGSAGRETTSFRNCSSLGKVQGKKREMVWEVLCKKGILCKKGVLCKKGYCAKILWTQKTQK
ncbi:hypothetical protein L596_029746 [Steinernema carpocapsae]|uniref:Uncharacterized protein n=1 Tax=Steinernema carpocapsae TaxID=34508 RepID=A0A4U5LQP6_STECR|nr:hypothetical protein L596_029746 [Steinernema carpocapsae]